MRAVVVGSLPKRGRCHDLPVVSIEMGLTISDHGDLNASRNRQTCQMKYGAISQRLCR